MPKDARACPRLPNTSKHAQASRLAGDQYNHHRLSTFPCWAGSAWRVRKTADGRVRKTADVLQSNAPTESAA